MWVAQTTSGGQVTRVEVVPAVAVAVDLWGGTWQEVPHGTGVGWWLTDNGRSAPWPVTSDNSLWLSADTWASVDVESQWALLETTGLDAATQDGWVCLGGAGRPISDADLAAVIEVLGP